MAFKLFKPTEPGGRAEYGLDWPASFTSVKVLFALSSLRLFWVGLRGRKAGWWHWVGLGLVGWKAARLFYQARFKPFARRDLVLSKAEPGPNARILDLGGGRGLTTIGAARRWPDARLTAVDHWRPGRYGSEESLRSNLDLEDLGGRVHVFQVEPDHLPFEDNSFDLILSNLYFHTLPDGPTRQRLLSEAARVLKPGGRLILADYTEVHNFIHPYLQTADLKVYVPFSTITSPQVRFIRKIFAGFDIVPIVIADKPML